MWEYEHAVEADIATEAIWRLWADVPAWAAWNTDIEEISLDGPFAVGSTITMRPAGQDAVVLRLTEVLQNQSFVDEAVMGELVIRTSHRLDPISPTRLRVIYRTVISGPAADELGPQIGPQITADFPETLASLIEHARR